MKTLALAALSLCTACLLATGPASAAVVGLVDTMWATDSTDGLLYTVDGSGLDLTGASKIVVTLATEGNVGNQSDPNPIESLTYGGVEFSLAAQSANTESSVYFLDLAGKSFTGTDFVLDFEDSPQTAVRGYGFAAISLSNTADGVSFTTETGGAVATIEPPTAGQALVSSYARNNNHSPGTPLTAGLVEIYDEGISGGGLLGYTGAAYYKLNLAAGPQDIEIDGMNASGRTVHATFAVIPEPSSLALLGLGGLLIARRRR